MVLDLLGPQPLRLAFVSTNITKLGSSYTAKQPIGRLRKGGGEVKRPSSYRKRQQSPDTQPAARDEWWSESIIWTPSISTPQDLKHARLVPSRSFWHLLYIFLFLLNFVASLKNKFQCNILGGDSTSMSITNHKTNKTPQISSQHIPARSNHVRIPGGKKKKRSKGQTSSEVVDRYGFPVHARPTGVSKKAHTHMCVW